MDLSVGLALLGSSFLHVEEQDLQGGLLAGEVPAPPGHCPEAGVQGVDPVGGPGASLQGSWAIAGEGLGGRCGRP